MPAPTLPRSADVIAALATAPGRGAIAIVRVSGLEAHAVAERLIAPLPAVPRRATLSVVRHPRTGAQLDEAVVTLFEAGHSYTGDPAVEIACHGGWYVPALILEALVDAGARLAEPGEFTRRAVLNGRLDLLQAEAVGDLVDAGSGAMHRSALAQLDGGLSRRILELRELLIEVEALIAYDIDFPEEDDGPVAPARILSAADSVIVALDGLLATSGMGELVREGALVVLAGAPNVGKSSLFNALLGRSRAIVTEVPGTTRDAIEATVEAGGWKVRLVDTAGLRATHDTVERIGIEVSEAYVREAHLLLVCGDDTTSLSDALTRARSLTSAPLIAVRTKIDLESAAAVDEPSLDDAARFVAVSAERGMGMQALVDAVASALAEREGGVALDAPMLTRARHREAVKEAREELGCFRDAWSAGALPAPVAAVHLRGAIHALEEMIGSVDVEEVLDRVFASFCVGK